MTKDEAIEKLQEIRGSGGPEEEHMEADDVLCVFLRSLGYEAVVNEYHKIKKWYA